MKLALKIVLIVLLSIVILYMNFRMFNLLFSKHFIYSSIDLLIITGLVLILYVIIKKIN